MFGKLPQAENAPALELLASIQTDAGCVRSHNEDSSHYVCPNDPGLLARKGALVIVADGMGGHACGEVASHMAVEAINRVYYVTTGDIRATLAEAVRQANREIFQFAAQDNSLTGMGTTCVLLAIVGGFAYWAHVGDSRLYLQREQQIYQLTEDHSAVMEMVRLGLLSREEAQNHPDKNIILRAVGMQAEVEAEMGKSSLPVLPGDQFLLCSDGLSDLVSADEMKDILLAHDPHAASTALITLAKERGGHDNITVAIVKANTTGTAA
ncbi:MAG: Stp1/IreP family PP2C-type Ser/Thr phosphatase [Blastocatellia bacterium]